MNHWFAKNIQRKKKDYDSLATTHAATDADTAPDFVCGDKPPPAARAETPESDAITPAMPPSPPVVSPPAKRTRKAAKRRCEVELLRDEELEGELQLSPLSCATHSPSLSPPTPSTLPKNVPFHDDLQLPPSSPTLPSSPSAPPSPTSPSAPPMPSPPTSSPPTSPRFQALPTPPPIDKSPTIPAAPPMSAYFPSCPFKVICRYCLRDDHDVWYRQCPNCYKKRGGTNYHGW
jgi:hypothetical protein